jgi:hypothetical protein
MSSFVFLIAFSVTDYVTSTTMYLIFVMCSLQDMGGYITIPKTF